MSVCFREMISTAMGRVCVKTRAAERLATIRLYLNLVERRSVCDEGFLYPLYHNYFRVFTRPGSVATGSHPNLNVGFQYIPEV